MTQDLPERYISSLCEVKSMSNELLALGRVTHINQEYFEIGCRTSTLPIIHANAVVKVQVYNQDAGFKLLIGMVYLSTPDFLRITNTRVVVNNDRRKFFRVPVDMETKIAADSRGVQTAPHRLHWVKGTIANVSLNGVYLICDDLFMEGQELAVQVTLKDIEIMHCQILNIEPVDNGRMGYGCQFLDCSPQQTDALCHYIFVEQRKAIQQTELS